MSRWFLNLLAANVMFTFFTFVLASNGLLTDLLGTGTAHNDEPFWMKKIKHQGISPFNPNATEYKVFRNVKVSSNRIICVLILCSTILSGLWRNW
jgi:glucan 1,3-beta-glucosidase